MTPETPPLVSVVIPTFHRPALLQRCLDALARQRLPREAFEIIVVDDGHDDILRLHIAALAAQAPPYALRYLRPMSGRGPAVARNHGWRAARAPLIAFTDDDTVPDPGWLDAGLRAMAQSPCVALAGRVVVPPLDTVPSDHELMTRGLETAVFVTANAFVRKSALVQVGGFDERFRRAWREDADLQFRLQRDAGPVGRATAAVVLHPVRPERWGVSLRQQKNVFYDALLYREHPQRYRDQLHAHPPWRYHLIVALTLVGLAFGLAGHAGPALAALGAAAVLIVAFAANRLRHTSRAPGHVLEMLLTSAAIPFLSVYWRWRGACHFKVWFP